MSYFAILCRTGQENTFETFLEMTTHHAKNLIAEVISPAFVETKITDHSATKRYIKTSMGYIFIKVKNSSENMNIPNELYHFLNKIPVVSKIFPHEISEEEVKQFCKRTGYNFEEKQEETEVVIEVEKEHDQNIQNNLHEMNFSMDKEKQQEQVNPSCIGEKMIRLVRKAKEKSVEFFKRILVVEKSVKNKKKVVLRTKHEVFLQSIQQAGSTISHSDIRQPKKVMGIVYDYLSSLISQKEEACGEK